jgi:hypothetical protein
MDVHVEIEQIADGYVVSFFDHDSMEEPESRHYKGFRSALSAIKRRVESLKESDVERRLLEHNVLNLSEV